MFASCCLSINSTDSMKNNPKKPTTTMEKLPGEVLTDILIRLPAKCVAQLRCVSKPLNALLSQPLFIKSHFHRSIRNNDEMLLVFDNMGFCFEDRMPIAALSPHTENPNLIKLPEPFNVPSGYKSSTVIGSINGLICFVLWSIESQPRPDPIIYIWNPSLNALRILPPYTICAVNLGLPGTDLHIRFGYDPKADDYKVVKFTRFFKPSKSYSIHWLQVEVYSMRKGSWKLINDRFPSHLDYFEDNVGETMIGNDGRDGHIHYLCADDGHIHNETYKHVIVEFDLSTETFSELSLPDSLAKYNEDQRMVLGDLDGKLCVMSYIKNGHIELWVMNEYGVAESWVKHQVFSQFSGNFVPIGFTLKNEVLLKGDNDSLALYDQIDDKVKPFKVRVKERDIFDRVKVVPYVDSLVWIAPAN